MIRRICVIAAWGSFVASLVNASTASGATVPYFENFDDEPDSASPHIAPSEPAPESGVFNETNQGNVSSLFWQVPNDPNGPGKVYRGGFGTNAINNSSAAITFSNVVGNSFYMTSEFENLGSFSGGSDGNGGMHVGFGAFGDNAHFFSGKRYELVYVPIAGNPAPAPLGSIRLLEVGGDGQVNAISSLTIPVSTTATYTLGLYGFYTGGTLNLVGTLTRPGFPSLVVADTDTTPLAGTNFGYTVNSVVTGASTTLSFDNFSLIPEPASLSLLALAALGTLFGRRSRHRHAT